MSDSILQDLRRRAAATGSPEDAARLLVERLRVASACERCGGSGRVPVSAHEREGIAEAVRRGMTTDMVAALAVGIGDACPACAGTGSPLRARVELAAYCGDQAARAALGDRVVRRKDGYLCCCGMVDRDHPMTIDAYTHSPVHACTYVGGTWPDSEPDESLPCSCEVQEHERRYPVVPVPEDFSPWVSGLSRWSDVGPGWVLVAAAVAAARVAMPVWEAAARVAMPVWEVPRRAAAWAAAAWAAPRDEWFAQLGAPGRAIEAAEVWLACPCEEHRVACIVVWEAAPLPTFAFHLLGAVREMRPGVADGSTATLQATYAITSPSMANRTSAVHLAGEPAVRTAIQESLTRWALQEER